MAILVLDVGVFLTGFIFIVMALGLSFLGIGGRDDAKIAIPGTVVLRHMFSPAEMRVGSCPLR